TTPKILDSAITAAKIEAAAIDQSKLAADAGRTPKILDAAITSAKLNDTSVTEQKITPSSTNGQVLTTVVGVVQWADPYVSSDREQKLGFAAVNPFSVLDRLIGVPISTWSYRSSPGVVHIGPMAQDFSRAFGYGADNKRISIVDAQGVSFASIQ